jgi:hypothetical protein
VASRRSSTRWPRSSWADRWAAYLLSGAPRPVKPPKAGPERARRERLGWYRHLLAWAVGTGLMGLGALLVGFDRSSALLAPAVPWTIVLVIDFFVSFSYSAKARPLESARGRRLAG